MAASETKLSATRCDDTPTCSRHITIELFSVHLIVLPCASNGVMVYLGALPMAAQPHPAFLFHTAPSRAAVPEWPESPETSSGVSLGSAPDMAGCQVHSGASWAPRGLPAMVTLRFLQTVGMGSPDSTLHKSSPSIAKTLPMAEIPALCITLVESALQHARQSCPVLLALEGDALLFTTPKGQELHLVHLASDLRTRLEQVRAGVGNDAEAWPPRRRSGSCRIGVGGRSALAWVHVPCMSKEGPSSSFLG